MKLILLVVLAISQNSFVSGLSIGLKKSRAPPSAASLQRARDVLDQYPVIDGHNDFPMGLRDNLFNDLRGFDFNTNLKDIPPWNTYEYGSTDLVRMKQGKLGGQFWSAYINCDSNYKDAVQLFIEQVEVIKRLVAQNPDNMTFVTDADGIEQAFTAGKVASLIGVESGHAINSNMAILRTLYELGTRYMTLTHGCNTPWADAAQVESGTLPLRNNGISDFGRQIVLEMNRLGMFVDLSHVSSATMRDVLDVTMAPVIFSHSSAKTLCPSVRNVPDDVLARMPDNGGVVMVNFYPYFLTCTEYADVYDIVDHINYIRTVAGIDHVGIGSDFCGTEVVPVDVPDASAYPLVFAALLESTEFNWTDEDLGKVASGNLIRAMREMEAVRDSLASNEIDQDWINLGEYNLPQETTCMSEVTGPINN